MLFVTFIFILLCCFCCHWNYRSSIIQIIVFFFFSVACLPMGQTLLSMLLDSSGTNGLGGCDRTGVTLFDIPELVPCSCLSFLKPLLAQCAIKSLSPTGTSTPSPSHLPYPSPSSFSTASRITRKSQNSSQRSAPRIWIWTYQTINPSHIYTRVPHTNTHIHTHGGAKKGTRKEQNNWLPNIWYLSDSSSACLSARLPACLPICQFSCHYNLFNVLPLQILGSIDTSRWTHYSHFAHFNFIFAFLFLFLFLFSWVK